jgi:polyphosphate kinase
MDRNLFRRVEVAFPVQSEELQSRILDELNLYLQDDVQAWELGADGRYARVRGDTATNAQTSLMMRYDDRVALIPET